MSPTNTTTTSGEGNSPLRSEDGHFQCTVEHAVSIAYLINCAEAATDRTPSDKYEIGRCLAEYCYGDITYDEAMAFLNDDLEASPASPPIPQERQ